MAGRLLVSRVTCISSQISKKNVAVLAPTYHRCALAGRFLHTSSPISAIWSSSQFVSRNKEDGVPPSHKLVYSNNMVRTMYASYLATGISSVAITTTTIVEMMKDPGNLTTALLDIDQMTVPLLMGSVFGWTLFLGIWSLATKSILRIYWFQDTNSFTMVRRTTALQRKVQKFKPEDVRCIEPHPFLKELVGNYRIKGERVLVFTKDFISNAHYNNVLKHAYQRYLEKGYEKE